MSELEANKAIALKWVELSVAGDGEAVRALFAPDCLVFVAGDMGFCGWMDVAGFFGQTSVLELAGPITFEVGEIVAEGDLVWFEAQSQAVLRNGNDYRNNYMFQMRMRQERIVEYKEFGDTLHIWRVMDHPLIRGEAIARQALVREVRHRFVGRAIGQEGSPPQDAG
jgi:ketosteroid isomerase-like protein